jgi:hypothetical protein
MMLQTRTGRQTPAIGEPFFLTVVNDAGRDIPRSRTIFRVSALEALEEAISEAKHLDTNSAVYYCVPVGEADAAHSHMKSTLEVLGSAAVALEEGGYDSTEGTAIT